MSAVLCLPACLCVSAAASRGQAPHGKTSKVLHRRLGTTTSQEPQGTHSAHTQHPHNPQGRPDPQPAQHQPPPSPPPTVPPPHHPPPPPPETRPGTQHAAARTSQLTSMPPPTHATANPPSRDRHIKTPSPDPTRDNDDHPPRPTPRPPSHAAPPAAAPAEPYALHNPAAVWQHLRVLGDQKVLRLHTSGTTQRIRANTLVQAATLGEGVRDFLFDAFLHIARHDRPPRATPDSESPPPTRSRIWVPPIDWGRHLVRHPVPERDSTQGRTCYREANMAHPPPSTTPDNTKEWERETLVARMASLSNFRHHVTGDIPTPDDRQPAPSTYMTLMYNLHFTLSTTHYHAPTDHWVVHGTDPLLPADYAPPPTQPRP